MRPEAVEIQRTAPVRRVAYAVAAGVFAAAFAARLIPVFLLPGIHVSDEIFQSIEQAHRLVFGWGIVPWEFDYGTRSWLLPGFIAGLMQLSRLLGDGPDYYLPVIGIALAALSAASVLCGYFWGRRYFGMTGGALAAALPAFWVDCVYFGPRTLSESVAAHLLVIAAYLVDPHDRVASRSRVVIGGALLGLIVPLRLQLMPAIAVVMVWALLSQLRSRSPPLVAGFLVTVSLAGAVDAISWSYPFETMWRNVTFNLYYGINAEFGVAPWYYFVVTAWSYWHWTAVALVPLILIGALRLPILLTIAIVIVASHSFIPHKEFRFIYPAILAGMMSAGLGLAQLVAWIRPVVDRTGTAARWLMPSLSASAAAGVVILSLGQARSAAYANILHRGNEIIPASSMVAHLANVCGIGTLNIAWWQTGGYAHFHQPVRYYWPTTAARFMMSISGFNTLVYSGPLPRALANFAPLQCFGRTCVAQRPGSCEPIPMVETGRPPELEALVPDARR